MSQISPIYSDLRKFLTESQVLSDPESCAFYGKDWIKDYQPSPSLICLPENTEQVASIVRLCREHRIGIVPSGGRTGLSGGATACSGEIILSLERMRRVIAINPVDRTITCEAGVVLEKIQQVAEQNELYFPVDFSSRGSCQIGGNIATNAGGIRVIRYGNIREWVVGLEVVTGNGEILTLNGSLFKNNTGLDFRSLFIGSEGILGVITQCTLRLTSRPGEVTRILCGLESTDEVVSLLEFCRARLRDLSAFEFMERSALYEVVVRRGLRDPFASPYQAYVLVEVEQNFADARELILTTFSEAFEQDLIQDVVVSESTAQAQELMNLRDLVSETLSTHYTLHKNDISVPVPRIPEFLSELHASLAGTYPDFKVVVFGHVGDGNLHLNVLKPEGLDDHDFWEQCHDSDQQVFEVVQRYRGSISAEHGVGMLKREFLHYTRSAEEVSLMRGVKGIFDPLGIMNPGKVIPDVA